MDIYLPLNEKVSVNSLLEMIVGEKLYFPNVWFTYTTDLWLPKFELTEKRINLQDLLKELGMLKIMQEPSLRLFEDPLSLHKVDKVFQSSALKVEESGTEASAVTLISMDMADPGNGVVPEKKTLTFHADSPFVFTISEATTEAILFAGVFRGE